MVAEASLLNFKFCDAYNPIFYIFRTFLHFGEKCIVEHLFQDLLFFPCIILTLYRQDNFVFSNTQLSLLYMGVKSHSCTRFVTNVLGFVSMSIKSSPFLWDPGI